MLVASSNPACDIFCDFYYQYFHTVFKIFINEKGEHYFIVHADAFYTALFSQNPRLIKSDEI